MSSLIHMSHTNEDDKMENWPTITKIMQRNWEKAFIFSKSWIYSEQRVLEVEKKERCEKYTPTHKTKIWHQYGKSHTSHSVLCSPDRPKRVMLSSPTPHRHPFPRFMDISPQSSAKTKPAIFHRACYFTVSQERFIQHVKGRKKKQKILFNKPHLGYESRSLHKQGHPI